METKKPNFSDIIQGTKPVLVDFYADWCGPCKMMNPVLQELAQEYGEDVTIVKINVDKNPKAASEYGVRGVPTFLLYKKGEIKWRQSGAIPKAQLKQMIDPHK